jgi:hypothetical protein
VLKKLSKHLQNLNDKILKFGTKFEYFKQPRPSWTRKFKFIKVKLQVSETLKHKNLRPTCKHRLHESHKTCTTSKIYKAKSKFQ